ncbi:MAG TPA: metalloregulator ArsR/SmtB family transcription factor [Anaerolineae bacterium]
MDRYRQQANLLKLLAHPARLEILDVLRRDAECVCHLSAALHKPQPYISQQLSILRNAGLIADEKDGTKVFYRLADQQVLERLDGILGPLPDALAPPGRRHAPVAECACPKCRSNGG